MKDEDRVSLAPATDLRHTSFLVSEDILYFAYSPFPPSQPLHHPHLPISSVTSLIQGIYESYPERAHTLLRHRIYTSEPANPRDEGMVKVAAKRFTRLTRRMTPPLRFVPPMSADPRFDDVEGISWSGNHFNEVTFQIHSHQLHFPPECDLKNPKRFENEAHAMEHAFALAKCVAQSREQTAREGSRRYECDRKVAAVLVDAEGKVLAQAVNTNHANKTLHAEVNLLQGYFASGNATLPSHCRLYVTLKPCKMCAGMIWQCAQACQRIEVIYGEEDLGPCARATALDTPWDLTRLGDRRGRDCHVVQRKYLFHP